MFVDLITSSTCFANKHLKYIKCKIYEPSFNNSGILLLIVVGSLIKLSIITHRISNSNWAYSKFSGLNWLWQFW